MAKERDYEREIELHDVQSKIEKVQLQIEQKDAELASLKKAVSDLEVTTESDPELDRLVAERKHLEAILRAKDRYKKACEALLPKAPEDGSDTDDATDSEHENEPDDADDAADSEHENEPESDQQVIDSGYGDGD